MYCIGIGSGSGVSGRSQASVQSFLSMRHGLPVNDRERTVARESASSSCCFWAGGRSASSTVSHSEPAHTPWAPSASAAAIWPPEPTPPAASIGVGAMALATCGHSTIEPTSPVWPPPSPPWAMTMSTPASLCFRAWYGEPHSAATFRPASWMCSMTSAGGVPSALAMSRTFGWRSATSICGSGGGLGPPEQAHALVLLRREVGHAGVGEDLVGELDVLLRHHVPQHLPELLGVELVHPLVLAGDHDVDAVGLVADVLVDPLQLDLELLGREADGAEHAEAAGLGDGGHDVAAVGEGEDRELDAELVAEGGVHVVSPWRGGRWA